MFVRSWRPRCGPGRNQRPGTVGALPVVWLRLVRRRGGLALTNGKPPGGLCVPFDQLNFGGPPIYAANLPLSQH